MIEMIENIDDSVSNREEQQIVQCPICTEKKEFTISLHCNHTYCKQCLELYLKNQIDEGIVMINKCPLCQADILYEEIISNVNQEYVEKYIKYRTNQYAEKDPTLRHCPNKECELYVTLNQSKCKCGQKICIACGNIYHGHSSCDELMDNIFNLNSRKEQIQRCPNCKIIVQKEAGCNHMTCRRCTYQFCWICRRKYTTKHYQNFNYLFGCPNKQFANQTPWKYPKIYAIIPFLILIMFSPLWILICLILFILHPLGGAYWYFNRFDEGAVRNLSNGQRIMVAFFIYGVGGIILFPVTIIYEIIFLIAFVVYCIYRFYKKIRSIDF